MIDQPRLAMQHVDPTPHDLPQQTGSTAMTLIGTLATAPNAETLPDIQCIF
jgi:hypothetical protein